MTGAVGYTQAIISTHSLTRRLTTDVTGRFYDYLNFNSQPHKEADYPSIPLFSYSYHFNSQPHKEADTARRVHTGTDIYFNSQPHKEADHIHGETIKPPGISTHSLTRRLTPFGSPCTRYLNFNSQPHKEADGYHSFL